MEVSVTPHLSDLYFAHTLHVGSVDYNEAERILRENWPRAVSGYYEEHEFPKRFFNKLLCRMDDLNFSHLGEQYDYGCGWMDARQSIDALLNQWIDLGPARSPGRPFEPDKRYLNGLATLAKARIEGREEKMTKHFWEKMDHFWKVMPEGNRQSLIWRAYYLLGYQDGIAGSEPKL